MKRLTDKQLSALAKKHKEVAATIKNGRILGEGLGIKKQLEKAIAQTKSESVKHLFENENVKDIFLGCVAEELQKIFSKMMKPL